MSKLIIDLNDNTNSLKKIRKILNILIGDGQIPEEEAPVVVQELGPAPVTTEAPPPIPVTTTAEAPPILDNGIREDENMEYDGAGLPWDTRIHSSSKVRNKDGTWKKKRGVDAALLEQVTAELRQPETKDASQVGFGKVNTPDAAQSPLVDARAADARAAAARAATAPTSELTWPVMLQKVAAAKAAGTFDEPRFDALIAQYGVTGGLPMLADKAFLWPNVVQELNL